MTADEPGETEAFHRLNALQAALTREPPVLRTPARKRRTEPRDGQGCLSGYRPSANPPKTFPSQPPGQLILSPLLGSAILCLFNTHLQNHQTLVW